MDYLNYIFVINGVGLLTFRLSGNVVRRCRDLKQDVRQKYPDTYWHFGNTISAANARDPQFAVHTDKLYRLQNALCKLSVVEYQMRTINSAALLALVLVALSVVCGLVVPITEFALLKPYLLIYVPVLLFALQLFLLWRSHTSDGFLSSLEEDSIGDLPSYKNQE